MSSVASSIVVEFTLGSGGLSGYLQLETDTTLCPQQPNQVYLRLYGVAEKLVASSGSLRAVGSRQDEVEEVLSFTKSAEASLSKPPSGSVRIEKLGLFFGPGGGSVTPTFGYDTESRTVKTGSTCYGAVKAVYRATYQLYLFEHAGSSCSSYKESYIVAYNFTKGISSSLTLAPPTCGTIIWQRPYGIKPTIEVNSLYPVRYGRNGSWCKINLYPWKLVPNLHALPGTLGQPLQRETVHAVDLLSFDKSSTVTLTYSMESMIRELVNETVFINTWGNQFSPKFNFGGDAVYDVEWTSERTFRNPKRRVVNSEEVVVSDMFGNVVEAYGSVQVNYTVTRSSFDFFFAPVYNTLGQFEQYATAIVVAVNDGLITSMSLSGPSVKE